MEGGIEGGGQADGAGEGHHQHRAGEAHAEHRDYQTPAEEEALLARREAIESSGVDDGVVEREETSSSSNTCVTQAAWGPRQPSTTVRPMA
jgi:hypothetical protein